MAKGKADKKDNGGSAKASRKQTLRKAGDAARDLMQQPVVSELVAAALTAAAASLANKKTRNAAVGEAKEASREMAAIGASVKRSLIDAARSLLDSFEEAAPAERTLARIEPAPATSGARSKGKSGKKRARA